MLDINLIKRTGRSVKLLICFAVTALLGLAFQNSYAQVAFMGYDYNSGAYPSVWQLNPPTYNTGTNNEVKLTMVDGAIKTGQICSANNNNISHYEIAGASEYLEISIPQHATSQFMIVLTGSTSSTSSAGKAGVVYSDKMPFDPNSCILAEASADFPNSKGNWTDIMLNPPTNAKSLRIYRKVYYGAGTMSSSSGGGRAQYGDNQSLRLASITVWATATPTQQTQNFVFNNVSTSAMNVNFTRGNGTNVAIFAKEGIGSISDPVDGIAYTANSDWKSGAPAGTQLGTSGYYCVYNGVGNSFTIINLKPNIQYTFQAFEYTAAPSALKYLKNTATNNPSSQKTKPLSPPTVTTSVISGILSNKATASGVIPDSGGVAISDKGLVWSTIANPTLAVNQGKLSFGKNGDSFSDFIKGLTPSTKYYVKAYAINSLGTSYGNEQSFTTSTAVPVLTANPGSIDFGENYYDTSPFTVSYTLTGANLSPSSGDITITAPNGFLISKSGNTGFATTLTIPYTGGAINSLPIYAQLPVTNYGTFSGNIMHSGGGTAPVDADIVKLSGSVVQSDTELSNKGTDFWLGFGYEESMERKRTDESMPQMSIYIATGDEAANIKVELPGFPVGTFGFPKTYSISPNSIQEVTGFPVGADIKPNLNQNNEPDTRLYQTGISNKSVHVTSTGVPVSVWMHTYVSNNSAAGSMIFPSNTWNSKYTVQSSGGKVNNGYFGNSYFFVIANEDNTEIEFTPSNPIINAASSFSDNHTLTNVIYEKGQTYKLTLNRGEVFNAMGYIDGSTDIEKAGLGALDLTGTVIKTNCQKKIAVFGGNGRLGMSVPGCSPSPSLVSSDHLIQQMLPNVAWGTKYLTVPTKTMEQNKFRIVVQDPATKVTVNKVALSGLINNLYYEISTRTPSLVESDLPISLTQFIVDGACASTSNFSGGRSDPEMIILSPVQQAINKATVYSASIKSKDAKSNSLASYINVLMKKEGVSSFKIDNKSGSSLVDVGVASNLTPSAVYGSKMVALDQAFTAHPQDANYVYATFKVSSAAGHTISSDIPFNAIAYGMSNPGGESYGYNAGTAIKNLSSIKFADNPSGSDTSSTSVKTGKNNPVTLKIALPHNPNLVDFITWDPGNDVRVTPAGAKTGAIDNVTNKAKYDGTIDVDGRTFYIYSSPVPYQFSEDGIYRVTATANGTFVSECGGTDTQKITVQVGRDNINFDFKTKCGDPNIEFINNTTAMPGTTINTWAWDFGDGTTSALKNPPPHLYDITKGYKYTVKLTTTNSVGSITTDSLKIDFSGGLETKFTASANDVCAGTKVSFDPSPSNITGTTSGTAETWTWNFGEGTPLVITGATSPIQEHTYTTTGKFYVKLTLKTSQGCENTYTDSVVVGSAPTSQIEAPLISCFGDSVKYVDKSSIDFGEIVSWAWTFDDGTTSDKQNPSHKWLTVGEHKATLTVTSKAGCPAINIAEHTVNVLPLPTAVYTVSSPLCLGTKVVFTDASTANTTSSAISEWIWDFGDGSPLITKTVTDTVGHVYKNAGPFKVKLTVKNAAGCLGAILEKTITINPIPEPDFTFSEVCVPNGKATFAGSNKNATTISTWAWDFGDGQTGTGQNPIHNYTAGGVYKVILSATNSFGCPVSISKDLTVYDAPTTSFEVANINNLCGDSPVQITDKSVVNGYGTISKLEIYWDYLNAPTQVVSLNTPIANGTYTNPYPLPTTATKNYRILIRSYTAAGCFTESYQDIVLNAVPVAVLKPLAPVCEEVDAYPLNGGSEASNLSGAGVYTGNGVDASGNFSPSNAGAGTHTITYTYTTTAGCTSFAQQDIVVNPTPDVNFVNKKIYVKERASVELSAQIVKGDNLIYKWSPSTYLSDPNIANPICSPVNDIVYTVTVTTTSGCIDTAKLTVNMLREIVAPNTFTPNGDGVNDTWDILYLSTYPGATLEVFNRYGKKIFNSTVNNMPWDGRFKGEDLPVGTYYYIIDPKNGTKTITGAVTIVR